MRRISLLLILILFVFLNGCNRTSIVGTYEYIDGSIQYWNESNYHSLEISGTSLVLKRSNNTIFKQGNLILGINLTRLEIVSYSSDFFIITIDSNTILSIKPTGFSNNTATFHLIDS